SNPAMRPVQMSDPTEPDLPFAIDPDPAMTRINEPPGGPAPIKTFDPKVDRPITTEVSGRKVLVEGDGWKVEKDDNTNLGAESAVPRVRLFELTRAPLAGGKVIVRFQARTEAVDPAFLELRKQGPGGPSLAKSKRIEGSTNWASYDVNLDIGPAGAG